MTSVLRHTFFTVVFGLKDLPNRFDRTPAPLPQCHETLFLHAQPLTNLTGIAMTHRGLGGKTCVPL